MQFQNKNKWKKNCPSCGGEQEYSCKKLLDKSIIEKWNCKRCSASLSHKKSPRTFFNTIDYKEKMSLSLKKIRSGNNYGERFKKKCRENKLKQIKQQKIQRTYNPVACVIMNSLNHKFGWNLQHGMNGGEVQVIGYSLDGYDKLKKIIFEYDEPKHHISSVKQKDLERQERLINHLSPIEFWRYDEKNNILKEVISGKEIK